jgi:hypothetical protein
MPSTIDRVSERVTDAVRALAKVSGDLRAAGQLLALLGWDLPPGVDDIGLTELDVSAIGARLDELIELRSREDVSDLELAAATGEVIVALSQAFSHLEDIARSLQATPDYLTATDIKDQFFPRLADLLIIQAIGLAAPPAIPIGYLLGVFEFTFLPADAAVFQVDHMRQVIRWDRLSSLVTDPTDVLHDVYGWGTSDFDGIALVTNIARVLEYLAAEVSLRELPQSVEKQLTGRLPEANAEPSAQLFASLDKGLGFGAFDVGMTVYHLRPSAPGATDGGIGLSPYAIGTTDTTFALSDTLSLVLSASAAVQGGVALLLRAGLDAELLTGLVDPAIGSSPVSFGLALRHAAAEDGRQVLFSASALSIDAAAITAGVGVTSSLDPSLRLGIEDGQIRVAADRADGFLASILPAAGLTTTMNLDVSWSHRDGLRIQGGAGLRTSLALHARIGPLQLDTLDLAFTGTADALTTTATVSGAVVLGPFTAIIDSIGAGVSLRFRRGNLGPVDLAASFVPPTGLGLAIDAGVVKGGGLIRYEPLINRYSGVLQLQAGSVGIMGLGVLDARLPGGVPGYALLVVLRATFPAIQIGFGFALTSVGGLLALNRRVDVDALRAQLAAGTAGRILAPEDPIRNAPALLADLATIFPIAPGITVVGPTLQLVWAKLVRFDIGVFIELPGPSRIVLLGSARAAIERAGRSYLNIRVDIVGVVDLQRRLAAFDAVLIDSQLLEILELTGGAAFRLSWGEQPYAVLTLGGFHPGYDPQPLVFPSSLTRIAMVRGTPEDRLYFRFEGYFAITSNTLQFGASVEAIIRSGNFNIQGIVVFDALIRFRPFHFRFDIRASVKVRYKSRTLAGLTLTGSLEGPGPIVLRARVCIELLFFDICFSDTFTLGSSTPPPVDTIASALSVLVAELENPAALHASSAIDRFVTLRPPPRGSLPIVSPLGQLVWIQHQAPLGLLLQRIGGTPLGAAQSIEATSAHDTTPEVDWFAPGSFADLTDDQALTRRGFERLNGGLRFGAAGVTDGPSVQKNLAIRQIRLPAKQQTVLTATAFPPWIVNALRADGGGAVPAPVPAAITVADENWTVIDTATGQSREGLTAAQAHQLAALAPAAAKFVAAPTGDRLPNLLFQEL